MILQPTTTCFANPSISCALIECESNDVTMAYIFVSAYCCGFVGLLLNDGLMKFEMAREVQNLVIAKNSKTVFIEYPLGNIEGIFAIRDRCKILLFLGSIIDCQDF